MQKARNFDSIQPDERGQNILCEMQLVSATDFLDCSFLRLSDLGKWRVLIVR